MKPVEIDTSLVNRRSSQDADSQVSEGEEEGSNEEESTNEEEESASSMTTTQAFEQSLRECQMKLQEAEERARASEMVHHLWARLFVLYVVLFHGNFTFGCIIPQPAVQTYKCGCVCIVRTRAVM